MNSSYSLSKLFCVLIDGAVAFCLLQHRQLGDDEADGGRVGLKEGWVAVPGQGGVVKEVKERTVKSREEKEERLETEDVQHLGDISDEVS